MDNFCQLDDGCAIPSLCCSVTEVKLLQLRKAYKDLASGGGVVRPGAADGYTQRRLGELTNLQPTRRQLRAVARSSRADWSIHMSSASISRKFPYRRSTPSSAASDFRLKSSTSCTCGCRVEEQLLNRSAVNDRPRSARRPRLVIESVRHEVESRHPRSSV